MTGTARHSSEGRSASGSTHWSRHEMKLHRNVAFLKKKMPATVTIRQHLAQWPVDSLALNVGCRAISFVSGEPSLTLMKAITAVNKNTTTMLSQEGNWATFRTAIKTRLINIEQFSVPYTLCDPPSGLGEAVLLLAEQLQWWVGLWIFFSILNKDERSVGSIEGVNELKRRRFHKKCRTW